MEFFFFWFKCFLAVVIPANILVSFQFKVQLQEKQLKNILDDRALPLEGIASQEVLRISSDGDDRGIFLGLKFSILGFFWV